MNLLDVVTKKDLMKPSEIRDGRNYGGYNLKPHFIKMHGRLMGGIGKPMIFDRNRVEAYLDRLFGQQEHARSINKERDGVIKIAIDRAIDVVRRDAHSINPSREIKILGNGGRQKGVAA